MKASPPSQLWWSCSYSPGRLLLVARAAIFSVLGFTLSNLGAQTAPCGWSVGEWHQWPANGHYYSVQAITGEQFSWLVARAQARALVAPNGRPADLATLASAEENAFVFSGIDCPDYWAIDGAGNNEGPNLGGFQRDKNNEAAGSWTWVSGEPWIFTNWSPGEPNNSSGVEDVLTFFSVGNTRSARWNDISTNTGSVVQYYVAESTDAQPCTPAPAGLVSWWQADGNAMDAVGGNNGIVQGAVTFVSGKAGQAFSLGGHGDTNGNGDRVRVANSPALQTQNFTIDAWIRRASASIVTNNGKPGVEGGTFFAFGNGGYGFLIDQATNQLVLTRVQVSNVKSSGTITDTNYHHVAVTKSGSQVIFYIDGVPAGSVLYDTGFTFTTNPAIGARGDNDVENAFFGDIDELQIFNRPLSPAEIQAIFNAGSSGVCTSCVEPPSGMVAWLPGDGNGSDISGHGNNGALLNGAGFATGMVGQAFSFDGVNDVVDIPDSTSLDFPNAPFSVELWAFRTSSNSLQHLLGKRNNCTSSNTEGNYQLGWTSAGGGHYFFGNPGGPETSAPADFPLNTWVHIAGTFDGSNYRLYVNGELIQTVAGTTGPINNAPLRLGNSGSCEPFGGRL
ncbi:MAG TPA: LamG-like jellyroll fold domain-containing protein, partial [Chthoniobacterales bacterium]|nr:LamG-like jellyroll fold domain-containing protein [Chthoniobacterales bacterium]